MLVSSSFLEVPGVTWAHSDEGSNSFIEFDHVCYCKLEHSLPFTACVEGG